MAPGAGLGLAALLDIARDSETPTGAVESASVIMRRPKSQKTRLATRLPGIADRAQDPISGQKSAAMPMNLPLLARMMSSRLSFCETCFFVLPSGPWL